MKPVNKENDLELVSPIKYREDFYNCPLDDRLAISKDGRVLNKRTNRLIAIVPCDKNRPRLGVVITEVGKQTKRYTIHRLLAFTFIGRPSRHLNKAHADLEVNHIDGDQLNNQLRNLEWVTSEENTKHALDNNLWVTLKEVQVRNNQTGSITTYRSMRDVANSYEVHLATLSKHLNSPQSGRYDYSGFSFRYSCDEPWPTIIAKKRMALVTIAFDLIEKSTHTFDSMSHAAKYIKHSYTVINKALVIQEKEYWRSKDGKWEVQLIK